MRRLYASSSVAPSLSVLFWPISPISKFTSSHRSSGFALPWHRFQNALAWMSGSSMRANTWAMRSHSRFEGTPSVGWYSILR